MGHGTIPFPDGAPPLPERFRGRPRIDPARCVEGCARCAEACPTGAIVVGEPVGGTARSGPALDLGRCLFCTRCSEACPEGAIQLVPEHRMATTRRDDLWVRGDELRLARAIEHRSRRLFGRSLRLRQVSAGGCNGCEAEVNALSTVTYDLSRFGIDFVASPRHADGLLVTGPVTRNMRDALRATWDALPAPRFAIAVGACAISGGPFAGHPEVCDGAADVLPLALYVPGCPPHPLTMLDGLLRLLGRVDADADAIRRR